MNLIDFFQLLRNIIIALCTSKCHIKDSWKVEMFDKGHKRWWFGTENYTFSRENASVCTEEFSSSPSHVCQIWWSYSSETSRFLWKVYQFIFQMFNFWVLSVHLSECPILRHLMSQSVYLGNFNQYCRYFEQYWEGKRSQINIKGTITKYQFPLYAFNFFSFQMHMIWHRFNLLPSAEN